MKNWKVQRVPDLPETGKSIPFQNPRHFGMLPKTLTYDKSVGHAAFRVFGLLALQNYQKGKKTNIARMSTRELADAMGSSHTSIRTWLKELIVAGHMESLGKPRGTAAYRLTSPVFDYAVSVATAPGAVAHVTSKELPKLRDKQRKCPHCHAMKQITSTSKICGDCLSEWARKTSA